MLEGLKNWLRRSPRLVRAKRELGSHFEFTLLDIVDTFPAFAPNSAGKYKDRALLTIEAVNQTAPFMCDLATFLSNGRVIAPEPISGIPSRESEIHSVRRLGELLVHYGSDKVTHGYHNLYGTILADPDSVECIFEIGLGTNNLDVVSTMGASGRPGASLRAYRDLCKAARIFGADVDRRILFSEDRISTFFVDQTVPSTLDGIRHELPDCFDLVIDDGLHSPNANIASLHFGLQIVKIGGWVVVEDISHEALSLWQVVSSIIPPTKYRCRLFEARTTLVFAVQRIG